MRHQVRDGSGGGNCRWCSPSKAKTGIGNPSFDFCSRHIPCAVRTAAAARFQFDVDRRRGRHTECACYSAQHGRAACAARPMRRRLSHQPRNRSLCAAAPHGVGVLDFQTHCTIQCSKGCDSDLATRSAAAVEGASWTLSAAAPDFSTPLVTRATQAGTRPPDALLTRFVRRAGCGPKNGMTNV